MSQHSDSIVKINELSFKNSGEKKAFRNFQDNPATVDVIQFFLTPYDADSTPNAEKVYTGIDACVKTLKEKIADKSESKKIKEIYNYVHKTFFKVYELKNNFSSIFESGKYNCVSASALFAIIFSKLDIPYQIMETPQHVYLIAYPATSKILIETTTPDKGYYSFNEDVVKKYVKSLLDQKLITKEEFDTSSANSIFNRYYFSSEGVTLTQLAGLQYANYGIYRLEEKKTEQAIAEFKKAYFLYPCKRNEFSLKYSLIYQLANNNYNDSRQVRHFVTLCRIKNLNNADLSNEAISSEFSEIIQDQLINNSNYNLLDSSFALISEAITDSVLKKEIAFNYHYELGRLGFLNSKEDNYVSGHLQAAYLVNPNHANLQALISSCFEKEIRKNTEPSFVIDVINKYSRMYGYLNDSRQFNSIKADCLLELSYQYFSVNNQSKGDAYIDEFEKLINSKINTEPSLYFVERGYSAAAAYYYKKGNHVKSKQLVKAGLIYAPDSFGLKQRLSQF